MSWRWLVAIALSVGLVLGANTIPGISSGGFSLDRETWPQCAVGAPSLENADRSALVVYDAGGAWSDNTLVYAKFAATLSSHFAEVEMLPMSEYLPGIVRDHDAMIYVGLNYGEPLSAEFLADVSSGVRPVLWLGENLWQYDDIGSGAGDLHALYGVTWTGESVAIESVRYQDTTLSVPPDTDVHRVTNVDAGRVEILATADSEGSDDPVPYAVRSGSLTWIAEIPFSDAWADDRYLVLADLLNDVFVADPPPNRQALIRLEDVGPLADPELLTDAADVLFDRQVPFSIALYPVYLGAPGERADRTLTLGDTPEVVKAVEYMIDRGGTLILHGYSHQYGDEPNPLTGRSGDDFEFLRVYFEGEHLVYEGPVPDDSLEWVDQRLDLALKELEDVGLPRPAIFEFPHYGASENAYRVVNEMFAARYDHTQVFSGAWNGEPPMTPYLFRISAPYLVRDTYGTVTIPETLGFYDENAEKADHGDSATQRLLEQAETLSVVRGSVASLFFHPYLGADALADVVDGLAESGHEFVSPCAL